MNSFEQQNRLKKVLLLAHMLEHLQCSSDEAAQMDDERWQYTANLSGCTRPSEETKSLVIFALKTRENLKFQVPIETRS